MTSIADVQKTEEPRADFYVGTKEQLVATGLVRADQFLPMTGHQWFTFMNGVLVRRKGGYRLDEGYVRIQAWDTKKGTYRLWVGLSPEVRKKRRQVERDEFEKAHAAAVRAQRDEGAARARQSLAEVPRTADEFRRGVVREVRRWARLSLINLPALAGHGYALASDGLEDAMVALDAVATALMQAEVTFDHFAHLALVNGYQVKIVAGDAMAATAVARVTSPNAGILAEVSP